MINAIILAGEQLIKNWNDAGNKALLRINGKSMIEYVAEALRKSCEIGRIIVAGNAAELGEVLEGKVDDIIDSNGSVMQNLMNGIKFAGFDGFILACTSDIPMITPEAINDFITQSKNSGADFCYPIIDKKVNDEKYPEIERTYVKMKEGSFTGGNIFYINPKVMEKGLELADKLVSARKNPLQMAKILSFGFTVQLSLGILPISKVEKKFSNLMQVKAKAIISNYPEIGNDVDKPSDVIVASAHLSS